MGKKDNKAKKKEPKKVNKQETGEEKEQESKDEIEIRHSRLELIISALSLVISIISLLFSFFLTNRQLKMEYSQSLPNLSMSAEVIPDKDTGEDILRCQVKNDGGNIREAMIIPHLYLTYKDMPESKENSRDYFILEVKDLFATYNDGAYYSTLALYNPDEASWFIDAKRIRMEDAHNLLFLIAKPLYEYMIDNPIMLSFDFILEVRYVDIMGEKQVEWYSANGLGSGVIEGKETSSPSFQLSRIDEDSSIPLSAYELAMGIEIGDDLSVSLNDDVVNYISLMCFEKLFGNEQ